VNELREDLDRALRSVTFSEAPVERAKRRGRRIRARRRVAVLAGALAVAAVAAGYPALSPAIVPAPARPATGHHDPVVTAYPPASATQAPGGLTAKSGVIAQGKVGSTPWQVNVHANNTDAGDPCYTVTIGSDITPVVGSCSVELPSLSGGDPAEFNGTGKSAAEVQLGVVAANVTYFVLTFTDGQQLKLLPVTAGGHRFVAFAAPASMTVASLVAHLGSPYADSGQIETAVPFDPPGRSPVFGLWLKPGQAAPPRAQGFVGRGTTDGQAWTVTAYEGPWGTCFVSSGGDLCLPMAPLRTTAVLGGWGRSASEMAFVGSAAPGVASVRVTLSNAKSVQVTPVGVGNENLFVFWVGKGVNPTGWTGYDASGHETSSGTMTSLSPTRPASP
jgi:hypothetical protein